MGIIADVILPIALAFIMFSLGLGLTVADFTRVLRRPRDFLVGAISQIVLLPAVAFLLVSVWHLSPELALGVMIIAAAPGGVTSNILTAFARGDVALSISLTAIISLISIISVPFIIFKSADFLGIENISKEICKNIIGTYKRASNIIYQELKNEKENILGQPELFLFKKDEEKHLYNKINEIRQYFSNTKKQESYDETLKVLAGAKPVTDNFFDNVIVNDENSDIKKNRLELLQMFCKTYNNFIDFSKVEGA